MSEFLFCVLVSVCGKFSNDWRYVVAAYFLKAAGDTCSIRSSLD